MEIKEISREEYREIWEKSPQKNFLNSPEMIEIGGSKHLYFQFFKDGKSVGAAGIRGTKNRVGLYDYYAPRGILTDFHDGEILCDIGVEMKKALRRLRGVKMRMEPMVVRQERDIDGKIVPEGENNSDVVENLKRAGFSQVPYREGVSQIKWQFVLTVKGKSEEEILAGMKGNTRRRLKQALSLGMKIKELNREELPEFLKILNSTAERKNFSARDLNYFQKVYDALVDKSGVKFLSVVINPSESMKILCDIKKTLVESETKTKREEQDKRDALISVDARIKRLDEMFPEMENREITLSSGMFFTMKPEILHLSGGNDGRYQKLDAQYVLQWEVIKMAREQGYDRYNFYGIKENVDTEPDGVYEFKRGFGGVVEELVGEWEMKLLF